MKYAVNTSTEWLSSPYFPINGVTLRVNSLYDQDYSLGGQQPDGFDQMMTWYNNYCVVGWKVTVTSINSATYPSELGPNAYYLWCDDDPVLDSRISLATNYIDHLPIESRKRGQKRRSGIKQTGNTGGYSGFSQHRTSKIMMKGSVKKDFNLGDVKDNLQDLSGTASTNPSKVQYVSLVIAPIDSTIKPTVINQYNITVETVALLYDRKMVQDS